MDRTTIERHLINNPTNPFTREPLTKQDLVHVPHKELKIEIVECKLKNKEYDLKHAKTDEKSTGDKV